MAWNASGTLLARGLMAAAALVLAAAATAHDPAAAKKGQAAQPSRPAQASSDAFDRACVDLLHGKTPKGAEAIETLRNACAKLMEGRSEEALRVDAQRQVQEQLRAQQQAQVAAGQAAAPVGPGQSALAAFELAGAELVGNRPRGRTGMNRSGQPFQSTVVTNPVGWFTGLGVNAEVLRSFMPQFSWVAGAHYTTTKAVERDLYTLGFMGGFDWFVLGRNNEGLRVGPRADFSFGRENSADTTTRARLGLAGEVGYNFIATNGITGQAAFGLGGRLAGDENGELSSGAGGDFGPYVKLGMGFSW